MHRVDQVGAGSNIQDRTVITGGDVSVRPCLLPAMLACLACDAPCLLHSIDSLEAVSTDRDSSEAQGDSLA